MAPELAPEDAPSTAGGLQANPASSGGLEQSREQSHGNDLKSTVSQTMGLLSSTLLGEK